MKVSKCKINTLDFIHNFPQPDAVKRGQFTTLTYIRILK